MIEQHDLIAQARTLAVSAHAGQVDKLGAPYIGHPTRVAAHAKALGGSPEAIAAAWLHDVIEDCDVTAEDLHALGFPAEVIAAVSLLSKRPGQSLEDYCSALRHNPLALLVKRSDLADNTDPTRTGKLDERTRLRLAAKYERTRSLLGI